MFTLSFCAHHDAELLKVVALNLEKSSLPPTTTLKVKPEVFSTSEEILKFHLQIVEFVFIDLKTKKLTDDSRKFEGYLVRKPVKIGNTM